MRISLDVLPSASNVNPPTNRPLKNQMVELANKMAYSECMNRKPWLRNWHTWAGVLVLLPSLILSVSGFYLIKSTQPTRSLIAATGCQNGEWLAVSTQGVQGLDLGTLPFPLSSVSAVSCTESHIDMALSYGPIASTNRSVLQWEMIPTPFNESVRHIKRSNHQLFIATQTSVWVFKNQVWQRIESYPPTVAQRVYELHAGWISTMSFEWVWLITAVVWGLVSLSGAWIFVRKRKTLYKNKTEI
jgi:hypothetical protein